MIEIYDSNGQPSPPKIPYTPAALKDVRRTAPLKPAAAESNTFTRALGSNAQNSRSAGPAGSVNWKLQWQAPLTAPAAAVLFTDNRILLQQAGGWTLLSRDGKQIREGLSDNAPVTIDPHAGLFYSVGVGTMLQAVSLENAELRFKILLGHTEAFAWQLLHRSATRMIAAAAERRLMAPAMYDPTTSLIQIIEVVSPPKVNPYKLLMSIESQREVVFKNPKLLTVASGGILWAVLPGLIARVGTDRKIERAWSASFTPVAASADEAGNIHLIVEADNHRELWVVTPEGDRVVRHALGEKHRTAEFPPGIGYDHRIVLWSGSRVSTFSPAAEHLWDVELPDGVRGLSITPDGYVVAGVASAVHFIDSTGKDTAINVSDRVTAAPVITSDGNLLVATESKLLCYSRAQ